MTPSQVKNNIVRAIYDDAAAYIDWMQDEIWDMSYSLGFLDDELVRDVLDTYVEVGNRAVLAVQNAVLLEDGWSSVWS